MSDMPRDLARQEADVDQTNDQMVDQANSQDASHHSEARQEASVRGHLSQVDEQRVTVTVQNHLAGSAYGLAEGRLSGWILDSEGQGVAGVTVEVFFGPMVGLPIAIEQTDAHGCFRVDGVPAGFYSVRAGERHRTTVEQWNVRVDQGRESRLHLALPSFLPARKRNFVNAPDSARSPLS